MFTVKGFYVKGEEWVSVPTARGAVDEQKLMMLDGCHTVTIEWVDLKLIWTGTVKNPITIRDIEVATP